MRDTAFYILNYSINSESCYFMVRVNTWVRVCFYVYLLNDKLLGCETWPTNAYSHGKCFRKYFIWFGRQHPKFWTFTRAAINQNANYGEPVDFTTLRHALEWSKAKHNLEKINRSNYIEIVLKPSKAWN